MWYEIFSNFREISVYFRRNDQIAFLLCVIVLIFVAYILRSNRRKKLPPGPIGLPIFGYYLFLGKDKPKTLDELAKKYGNVIGFYLGPQYVVFLNDWNALKDAYDQNDTLDRPASAFEIVPYRFGVGGISGVEWIQTRRLSSKAMKDVGLHNTVWEELIQEEVWDLVEQIKQCGDQPIDVKRFFGNTFTNNIVTLVIGKRLPSGHPFTETLSEALDLIMELSPTLDMANFSPALRKLLGLVGFEEELSAAYKKISEFSDIITKTVTNITHDPDSPKEDSFILRFQKQIDNHQKSKEETYITEETIIGTVLALLAGGTDTSRGTYIWTLIALADNPDIQQKVHEELDRVIGREGSIRWPERFKIPYTFATLLEAMRWATLIPFTGLRVASKDIEVQGYHIPKGTFLSTNNYSLHNDPKYWKEPRKFMPERFLLDDGKKVNTAIESYNPFSYGKRNCPGKLMAMMEILQYVCTTMQNFKVASKDGNKVKCDELLGLTYLAIGAELRFIPR